MIRNATISLLAAALCAALAWGAWVSWGSSALRSENAQLRLSLSGCEARRTNIEEDRKRDATVFDPNFVIPPSWYVPEAGAGGQ